jgi:hypothetical protein
VPHEVTDEKRAVKQEADGEIPERRIQVYTDKIISAGQYILP